MIKEWLLKKYVSINNDALFDLIFADMMNVPHSKDYVGWVFAAIDKWGKYFAKADFRLYRRVNNGVEEVLDHPFLKMMNSPLESFVWWEFAYRLAMEFYGLTGNSYLHKGRDAMGRWVNIQPLDPTAVQVESSDSRIIDKYVYDHKPYQPSDIVQFRFPNPQSLTIGRPPISNVADIVDVNNFQTAYAKEFYKKGGFMGLTFSTDRELTKTGFNRLKKELKDRYGGKKNSFNVALFDGNVKPIPAAYSMKDMDVGKQRLITREEILANWNVPLILLGVAENYNRATAEAAEYSFTSSAVDPVLEYIDKVFTYHIQMEYGNQYFLKHVSLAPQDQAQANETYSFGLKNGVMAVNEVRREMNKNPFPYELANVPLVNVGGAIIRLDTGKQIASEDDSKEPKPTESDDNDDDKAYSPEQKDLLYRQFRNRTNIISRRFAKRLDNYTDGQRRSIIEALKNNYIVEQAFDLQENDVILWQLLEIDVWDIMKDGYGFGAARYGTEIGFARSAMVDDFNGISQTSLLVNQTTKKELLALVGNTTGEEAINKVEGYYKERDMMPTAISVTNGAFNAGLLQAMKNAGLSKKMWLSQRDSKVRNRIVGEDHVDADGQIVDLYDKFTVKSRSGTDEMDYPGDTNGSPENIIRCRCTIVGVS